jgi:hypothetical protein
VTDVQEFDFSVGLLRAILWQYDDAPNLQGLLEQKQAWYDANQSEFWRRWLTDVFDLRTANDFGLAVWSIILGQPTFISNGPSPATKPTWGFGQYYMNFTRGNFSTTTGNTYQLPTAIARVVLQLRYFQLTSSGTVPEINRMLKFVFEPFGPAYLLDGLDMTQEYFFGFLLPHDLQLALDTFDVLPRPAGVESSYSYAGRQYFGFGMNHANFTRGNFKGH